MNAPTKNVALVPPASVTFPRTNAEFLTAVFKSAPKAEVHTTSFRVDPKMADKRHWKGAFKALPAVEATDEDRSNTYYNPCLFLKDKDGNYSRHKSNAVACYVIVVDDVKAADLEAFCTRLPPSYVLETSPGNYQVGYFIYPCADIEAADYVANSVNRSSGDSSALGATRSARLPYGVNTKSVFTPPVSVKLVDWHPSNVYRLGDIAVAHGCEMDARARRARGGGKLGRGNENLVQEDLNDFWQALDSISPDDIVNPDYAADDEKGRYLFPYRNTHRADGSYIIGWLELLFVARSLDPSDDNRDRFIAWCSKGTKYLPGEVEKRWNDRDLARDNGGVGLGTFMGYFRRYHKPTGSVTAASDLWTPDGQIVIPTYWQMAGKSVDKSLWNALYAATLIGKTFAYDSFSHRYSIDGKAIDNDTLNSYQFILNAVAKKDFGETLTRKAISILCVRNTFNPVIDWLDSCPEWSVDDPDYLTILINAMGLRTGLECLMLKLQFIARVARLYKPGEKVDTMAIFQSVENADRSGQGLHKSTFLENTCTSPDRFLDNLPGQSWQDKDALMATHGKELVEIQELAFLEKNSASSNKAFISRRSDNIRVPYGHANKDYPRAWTLAGTVNKHRFLHDPTGSRRNFVLRVFNSLQAPSDWLADEGRRRALYGQIRGLYQAGAKWSLTPEQQTEQELFNQQFYVATGVEGGLAYLIEHCEPPFDVPEDRKALKPRTKQDDSLDLLPTGKRHFIQMGPLLAALRNSNNNNKQPPHTIVAEMLTRRGWHQWNEDLCYEVDGKTRKGAKGWVSHEFNELLKRGTLGGEFSNAEMGRMLSRARDRGL